MAGPLAGIRVVDLSRILAGPFCTMLLGDLGAEVIKIEPPGVGDDTRTWGPPWAEGQSAYYLAINRSKQSLTLNLKHEQGRALLLKLVEQADVVIENFKVGDLDRLGLGYQQLREVNPKLIHCSISGFGPDGPYASRPGYDFIAQGMGGLMSITGEHEGQPQKVGVAVADLATGLFACVGILAALRHRDLTGEGQHIDVSLLESVVALLVNVGSAYLLTGQTPGRHGNAHPNIVPYRLYQARDRWFIVATGNDRQYAAVCRVIGRPDLAEDARFLRNADRVANRELLESVLSEAFATRDADYWTAALHAAGVPAGPVNSVADVFSDPQVLARQMLVELEHPTIGTLRQAGTPIKLSKSPAAPQSHPPLLGEQTETILRELLSLDEEEIGRLRADGAI